MLHVDEGLLIAYCMDWLPDDLRRQVQEACVQSPQLQKKLQQIKGSLEENMHFFAAPPPQPLQEQIWQKLENINKEQKKDINDLPVLNKYSDYKNWLAIVQPLIPEEITKDRYLIPLRQTPQITQLLVISKTDFEEESHSDVYESFIILHGECECTIGDKVFRAVAGDFVDIPLYVNHHVQMLSPYVMAVLQHVAV